MARYNVLLNIFVFVTLVNLFSFADVEALELLRYNPRDLPEGTWRIIYQDKNIEDGHSRTNDVLKDGQENDPKILYARSLSPGRTGKIYKKGIPSQNSIMPDTKRAPKGVGMRVFYGRPFSGNIMPWPRDIDAVGYRGKPV